MKYLFEKLPVPIDYTSRDFYSLREDMINRVRANVPSWSGTDPADFGVALVDAFAYMGDIANYYIDRVVNESFITTATQRSSIINYARSVGYSVSGYRAATATIKIGNSKSTSLTLPQNTVVYADIVVDNLIKRVKFTTDSDVTVNGNTAWSTSTTTVGVTQGVPVANALTPNSVQVEPGVYGIKLSTSNGLPDQQFRLADNNVVDGSVKVYVKYGNVYVPWTEVTEFSIYSKASTVYTVAIDDNDYLNVGFGDGVSGAIPPNSSEIWVSYRIGDGSLGNIAAGDIRETVSSILYVPGQTLTDFTQYITVGNENASLGGMDPESNEAIRVGVSLMAGTIRRAVTLTDYENISFVASNLGKVKAYANSFTSVSLFVAPKRNEVDPSVSANVVDLYPGWASENGVPTSPTSEMNALLEDVASVVNDYTQIGVTVTTTPVYYTPIYISYSFTPVVNYTGTDVKANIDARLRERFSYANMKIADQITPELVLKEIYSVPGVTAATVTKLSNSIGSNTVGTLTGKPGEVFVLSSTNLIGINTGQSYLSNLVARYGTGSPIPLATLTPSFNSGILNYSVKVTTVSNGTFTLTPTTATADATAKITVNGTVVTSGSAITIPTKVGVTTVTIVVTNASKIETKYGITITRS